MWKFLIPRMNAKLAEREGNVKKILAEAQQLNEQAEKMAKLYDQKLYEAKHSQKEKLKKVIEFIQQSRVGLESNLQTEADIALKKLSAELLQVEHNLYKDISAKLENSIVQLIEKKLSVKVEGDSEIAQLLEKEIIKVTAND
ncbi:MAG: hypothetical protein H6492_01850 [Candidatus Paracaedibacteraceae bacterium]|nr:hypothetical protein [Candidatus Paracaedibacteraceae bacterium]